jgi:signal transduction histidine kinase
MRIATRVIAGYAAIIALVAFASAYQVLSAHRLHDINRQLAGARIPALLSSLQLMRSIDLVEEYSRKYHALGDSDYRRELEAETDEFESALHSLESSLGRGQAPAELKLLRASWNEFRGHIRELGRSSGSGQLAEYPAVLQKSRDGLSWHLVEVYRVLQRSIEAEVRRSQATGRSVEIITWAVASGAFVLSLVISWLLVRSISRPLRELTRGTHAISRGEFGRRISATGGDELAQLARDFDRMALRLGELDRLKKDFVSHVSHELKAPLASISETLRLLLDKIPGPLSPRQQRLLELSLQSSQRLRVMIGNLLDLSRMEAGVMEYELEGRDLVPLVCTAVEEHGQPAGERGTRIETRLSASRLIVLCDADRTRQVLSNLLGNALKFSPAGSLVEVEARPVETPPKGRLPATDAPAQGVGHGWILLTVSDRGPGVLDPDKERIFGKFQQVKASRESAQGVGLGLAISRTIAEAQGGALWVEDNAGGGSVFTLLLRLSAEGEGVQYRASNPI